MNCRPFSWGVRFKYLRMRNGENYSQVTQRHPLSASAMSWNILLNIQNSLWWIISKIYDNNSAFFLQLAPSNVSIPFLSPRPIHRTAPETFFLLFMSAHQRCIICSSFEDVREEEKKKFERSKVNWSQHKDDMTGWERRRRRIKPANKVKGDLWNLSIQSSTTFEVTKKK